MKLKLLLLTCVFSATALIANASPGNPGNGECGKKNDIGGGVTDADNKKPVGNVSITAYTANKKEKVIITDNNGNYSFDDLKPGTYKLVFEKSGYKKAVRDKILIKADEGLQLNIELFEEKDFDFVPGQLLFSDFK